MVGRAPATKGWLASRASRTRSALSRRTRAFSAASLDCFTRPAKNGEVFQIVKDLYYHPRRVQELAALVRQIEQRDGQVTAATFRDATELGRKRAIQILEFFDRIGFLRRVGDIHLLRPGTPLFAREHDEVPA